LNSFPEGHFQFAKYVDSIIQSRIAALISHPQSQKLARLDDDGNRSDAIYRDAISQAYMLQALEHYGASLRQSLKHVYHALPRLLSLWFELTAIQVPVAERFDASPHSKKRQTAFNGSGRNSGTTSKPDTAGEMKLTLKSRTVSF
jgi:hypothetical protein